jgi:cell division protease FtsH
MWSKSEFEASIASALGGHVAEALVFGEVTTGPSNDLQRATAMARRMVTEFGMSEQIGSLSLGGPGEYERSDSRTYGDETARQVDLEVRRVMALAHSRARAVLETNRKLLEKTARLLLEREVLESPELDQLLAGVRDSPPAELQDGWPVPPLEAPSGIRARPFDRGRQRLRAVYNSHSAPFGLPLRWSDDG